MQQFEWHDVVLLVEKNHIQWGYFEWADDHQIETHWEQLRRVYSTEWGFCTGCGSNNRLGAALWLLCEWTHEVGRDCYKSQVAGNRGTWHPEFGEVW